MPHVCHRASQSGKSTVCHACHFRNTHAPKSLPRVVVRVWSWGWLAAVTRESQFVQGSINGKLCCPSPEQKRNNQKRPFSMCLLMFWTGMKCCCSKSRVKGELGSLCMDLGEEDTIPYGSIIKAVVVNRYIIIFYTQKICFRRVCVSNIVIININPWCACTARVMVLGLCLFVCLCVSMRSGTTGIT